MNEADIVISCDDIDSVREAYIGELGFRLDSIFPADEPRVVRLSGFGIRLRIEQSADGDEGQEPDGKPQSLVVTSLGEGELAYHCLTHLVNRFWLNNLASMHNHRSLLNMDISGGMPAVIIKMLVASEPGRVQLLPALPQ